MATRNPNAIIDYLDRVLSDDYLFDQLRQVLGGGRRASRRARRKGVKDRQAQRGASQAIRALLNVAREARDPEPPPRRGRRLLLLAGAGAGAGAAAIIRARSGSSTPES
jgi:hypothetical protein